VEEEPDKFAKQALFGIVGISRIDQIALIYCCVVDAQV
jgi:hypothetical protein